MENNNPQKWYKSPLGVAMTLVLFFPLGLCLLWTHPTWTTKTKKISTGVFCAITILALFTNSDSDEPILDNIDNTVVEDVVVEDVVVEDVVVEDVVAEDVVVEDVVAEDNVEEFYNHLMNCEIIVSPVMNGINTEQIGESAKIIIDKTIMINEVSGEDLYEFAKQVVADSGYNWFTIVFEDGTGIVFYGSYSYFAGYCILDTDDNPDKELECLIAVDGTFIVFVDDDVEESETNDVVQSAEVQNYTSELTIIYLSVLDEINIRIENDNDILAYGVFVRELKANIEALQVPELSLSEKITIGLVANEISSFAQEYGEILMGETDTEYLEFLRDDIETQLNLR